ncbi:MAG: prephenate dehydrogenase, partial [Verrucomicrobiota bacterium]
MLFPRVAIVGVGLLGGSLALALRQAGAAGTVVGWFRRRPARDEALARQLVDEATLDLAGAVAGADLVVLGTPLAQMPPLVRALAPHLPPGTLVTDVGSAKAALVAEVEPLVEAAGARFIGSHPMAGSDKSGLAHSRADLFQQALCVVTPTARTPASTTEQAAALWRAVGGTVIPLDPARHDVLVARASHLPHVAAAALVRQVLGPGHPPEQALLCATGFRDTTRVAGGSPEMWRDIALANRAALGPALAGLEEELRRFRRLLDAADPAGLEQYFAEARQLRQDWAGGSPVAGS